MENKRQNKTYWTQQWSLSKLCSKPQKSLVIYNFQNLSSLGSPECYLAVNRPFYVFLHLTLYYYILCIFPFTAIECAAATGPHLLRRRHRFSTTTSTTRSSSSQNHLSHKSSVELSILLYMSLSCINKTLKRKFSFANRL